MYLNAPMGMKKIRDFYQPEKSSKQLLKTVMERLNLSARACDWKLKIARTIADLEEIANIQGASISKAIPYRGLNREGWLG